MARISRFEDLIAWQKTRILTKNIYSATRVIPFARDFSLCDQIRRSSVSVMGNIAEGFDRDRPREFNQFLSTAKGSCGETRSHLYVALDAGYLSDAEFAELQDKALEVSRIIGGLRASLPKTKEWCE